MNDTTPEIESIYRNMLMKKSGQERLMMGCSMFDTARKQALAGIAAKMPGLSEAEIRKELFLRFYGMEFSKEEKEQILRKLATFSSYNSQ